MQKSPAGCRVDATKKREQQNELRKHNSYFKCKNGTGSARNEACRPLIRPSNSLSAAHTPDAAASHDSRLLTCPDICPVIRWVGIFRQV